MVEAMHKDPNKPRERECAEPYRLRERRERYRPEPSTDVQDTAVWAVWFPCRRRVSDTRIECKKVRKLLVFNFLILSEWRS